MQIPLLGGTDQARFTTVNPQRTINWYPILDPSNKTQMSLQPTPGLTLFTTLPGRYARGLFTVRTHGYTACFAIMDNTLYQINSNGSYTTIGVMSALEKAPGRILMECNLNKELLIAGFAASYVYNLSTGALTQITDPNFPGGVSFCTYLDQYGIVVSEGAVFESLTTSFLNWSSLQSYSTTFKAAPVLAVGALAEEIFNFTSESIEIYINDGSSPYSRLPRSTMLIGILAPYSLGTWNSGFVFLGKTREGESNVFYFNGWTPPTPLMDSNLAWQLNQAKDLSACYGYVQQSKDGHYWYFLHVPTLNTTFVYDFSTRMWHERKSQVPALDADGSVNYSCFRGAFYTNYAGYNMYLDNYSGKVFIEDYTVNTEDTTHFIRRERISHEINNEDKNMSHDSLVIDCNTGSAPLGLTPYLQVSWSNDGGTVFNSPRYISLGNQGNYSLRARLTKLGTARRRVYKIVVCDNVSPMLQGGYLNGEVDSY